MRITCFLLVTALLCSSAFAALRPGLNVGTNPGSSNVIDGVQSFWTTTDPEPSQTCCPYTDFYLSLKHTDGQTDSQDVSVAVTHSFTGAGDFDVLYQGSKKFSLMTDTTNTNNYMHLEYICQGKGTATVTVTFTPTGFDPIAAVLTVACLEYPAYTPLQVGTTVSADSPDAVRDGVGIQKNNIDAFWGEDYTTFFVWIGATSPQDTVEYSVEATSNLVTMRPSVTIQNDQATKLTVGKVAQFTLDYECNLEDRDGIRVYVSITIGEGDEYESAQFSFLKYCRNDHADKNMSPVAVFFLVIFVLFIFGMLGGCMYNKFNLKKSGLAIIPGAETIRKWVTGQRDGTYYTPQVDYVDNQHVHDETYQSNL